MARLSSKIYRIHKTLVPRLLLFVALGSFILVMGFVLIDFSFDYPILGLKPRKLSFFESTILCFSGVFFTIIGAIASILSPVQMYKASALVMNHQGRVLKVKFQKISDSESTSYVLNRLDTQTKHTFFYAPKKLTNFLNQDIEAFVYLNKKNQPKAAKIDDFIVWLV